MSNSKKPMSCSLAVFFLIVLSLSVLFLAIFFYLPDQLEKHFDLQTAKISPLQRILYGYEIYQNKNDLLISDSTQSDLQNFEISPGESVEMICLRLEELGLISSSELFRMFLIYFGIDRNIQSGSFTLNYAMSQVEIAKMIADPLARNITFTILPGWRMEEIAESLASSGLDISTQNFLDYMNNPSQEAIEILGLGELNSLEGFLFPGTYFIHRETTTDQVINLFISEFSENVRNELREGFKNQGLQLVEAVTLASIIEKETKVDSEKSLIASVFFNRLSNGMRLETDPTVQYALGFDSITNTWWKSPLYLSDLEVVSEYNTYQIFGLPPGPISNPSLSSLKAVAFPAETAFFYFRAACDSSGSHNFSTTYQEHLLNECP